MLSNLTIDISKAVGAALSEEVCKLVDIFAANSELIESNFSSLRQRIDDLELNVIAAIKQEKKTAIESLKEENKELLE
jgi:hypothetical protein